MMEASKFKGLRDHATRCVVDVWEGKVEEDYRAGRICSEATLGAALYFHLRQALSLEFLVYVEPSTWAPGPDHRTWSMRYKPDIVICWPERNWLEDSKEDFVNAGVALVAIELKFAPFHEARHVADFMKLRHLGEGRHRVYPTLPHSGRDHRMGFELSKEATFAFGYLGGPKTKLASVTLQPTFEDACRSDHVLVLAGLVDREISFGCRWEPFNAE